MTTNSPLENLEFFDSFSVDDPLDLDNPTPDPNANIKPDILGGEDFDPLDEEEEEPALPKPKDTPPPPPSEEEEEEEEEEVDLEGDEDEEENYFEVFGKGLAKAGMLNVEEGEEIELHCPQITLTASLKILCCEQDVNWKDLG